jgi:F0F1-type ATP synthase assembly protein I
MHNLGDVGGTKGGLRPFLTGCALTLVGAYLFADRVMVHGGYWSFYRSEGTSFGITLLLLLIGVGMLFYDAANKLGWLLTVGGLLVIVTGIIVNLELHFRATSLWSTLLMLGLLAAGIGMVFRSLRPIE